MNNNNMKMPIGKGIGIFQLLIVSFCTLITFNAFSQTYTVNTGNWNTAATWSNGVPGASVVTTVNHEVTLNANLTFTNVGYTFNFPVTDPDGGANYSATGTGNSNAILDIRANTKFGGTVTLNNSSQLYIRSGDTLTIGVPNGTLTSVFSGSAYMEIEPGGVLIVNGNLSFQNGNNNKVDGQIIVRGNLTSSGGASTTGTGSISTTGSMVTSNGTQIFGSGVNCTSGPCNGSPTSCATSSITPSQTICSGNSASTLTGNALAGYTYSWQRSTTSASTGFSTITGAAGQNYSPGVLTTTTWYRRVATRTSPSCTVTSNTVIINVNSIGSVTANSNTPVCLGGSLNLTSTTFASASYSWTGPNGFTSFVQNPTIASATAAHTGTYTVTVTVPGCSSVSANTSVVTGSPSIASLTSSPASGICRNTVITFTAASATGGTPPYAYTWSSTGTNAGLGSSSTATNSATPTTSGNKTYSVYVTDDNGCTSSTVTTPTIAVSNTLAPTVNIIGSSSICEGATTNLSPAINGTWVSNSGTVASVTNGGVVTGLDGGSSTFTYTQNSSGCKATTAAVTVTPAPTVSITGNGAICVGATTTLSPTTGGSWASSSNLVATVTNAGVVTGQSVGSATFTFTQTSNGCKGTTSPVVVGAAGSWLGAVSTDWNTAANWCGGVPTATTDAIIPAGTPFAPTIAGGTTALCRNLTVNASATLTMAANTTSLLNIYGSFTSNGTFAAGAGSTVNYAGGNQTIIPVAYSGLATSGSGDKTLSAAITVSGDLLVRAGTRLIDNERQITGNATGTLTVEGGATLFLGRIAVSGTVSTVFPTNYTKANIDLQAGSTVQYNSWVAQTISYVPDYYNIEIQYPGSKSTSGAGTLTVNGNLGTASVLTFNGAPTVNIGGDFNLYATGATVTSTSGTLSIGGNFDNDLVAGGSFVPNGGTVVFNGTAAQSITGTGLVATNFFNLTINNTSGGVAIALSGTNDEVTVTNTLTMTNGILTTNTANLLNVTRNAVAAIGGGSATSFINGPVRWTASLANTYVFPVGKGTTYLPFTLRNVAAPTGTPTARVEAFDSDCGGTANFTSVGSLSTTEYWALVTAGTFSNSTVSLARQAAIMPLDVIAGSTTAGGTYTSLAGTVGTNAITTSSAITTNRFFTFGRKNAIRTGSITSPICAGAAVSVPFTLATSSTFAPGNIFTAQLSDASGDFTSPVAIGSITQQTAGTISGTIPVGTTTGSGYRIRVVSSAAPQTIGSDNGTDLTINTNTVGVASSSPTLCINTALTNITHTTTGATGISNNNVAGANGLPAGVRAVWSSNVITISGTPTASGTFNYSIALTGGCGSINATGTITVSPSPTASAGGSQTICQTGTATVSGANSTNGTILWTHNGAGSLTDATTLTPTYAAATGDAGNTVTLTMTVSNSPCTAATATYSVAVRATPTASAGGSQTICQNGTATVSGANSANGTRLWTHNGSGSLTNATTLTPTYTAATGDAGNTVTLTMTVSNSPCTAATATYSVAVRATPTASAGGSQTICQNGTATVSGANSTNGTILWTHNGVGSLTNATTLTPTYTAATGDAGNTVTLTMTVSNNPCTAATATYSVAVRATPTASAGGSQTICQNGTATVSGANSTNGTILWTHNGSGSLTNATTLTPTYTAATGDAGNTVTLTMTVSNNPCTAATATYSVAVRATPTASAGGSQTICQNGTATVSGANSANGTRLWTHNGSGSLTNATTLTPTYTAATGDAGNTVTLTMTVSNSPCTAATATYSVVVRATPTASAGGSQTICQNGTATVSGANSTNGTILWTHNGSGSLTNATTLTPTYTAATGDAGNTVTLTMTVSNNPCTAATATYSVAVRRTPTASAGGSQIICPTGTATVSGASATNGTILWTHNGAGSLSNATTITPTYTAAAGDAGNTVTLTMTVSNSPCAAATAAYTVAVRTAPTAVTSGNASICNGSSTNISVVLTGTSPWSLTYSDGSVSTNVSSITASPYTFTVSPSTTRTYTVTALSDANCSAVSGGLSGSAVITVNSIPSAPSITTSNPLVVFPGSTLTLGASGSGTFSWTGVNSFTASGAAPQVTISADSIHAGNYTVTQKASGCTSVSASVQVVVAKYYRSKATGNYTSSASWEVTSTIGGTHVAASAAPNSSTYMVRLQSPYVTTLDAAASVNRLFISNGATLNGNGNNLSVVGSFVNNGSYTSGNGTVTFSGSDIQVIGGTAKTTFYNLTVNNSGGGVFLGQHQNIEGTMTLGSGAKFTNPAGDTLTFLSTASETARLAAIPSNATFTGSITMQRYLSGIRGYRYFSSPIANAPLSQIADDMPVTGFAGGSTGNNIIATSPSMYSYNETVKGSKDVGWAAFGSSMSSTMENGRGYNLFVRRLTNGATTTFPDITVDMTGIPNKGDITISNLTLTDGSGVAGYVDALRDDGWHLIGNPYPCPISWTALWNGNTNISPTVSYRAVTGPSTYEFGYFNAETGIGVPASATDNISINQGVWLQVIENGPQSVTFKESMKSPVNTNFMRTASHDNLLRVTMNSASLGLTDEAAIYFTDGATRNQDMQYDANKFYNTNVSIATLSADTMDLALNSLPLSSLKSDTVNIAMGSKTGSYSFTFQGLESFSSATNIILEDKHDSTLTLVVPGVNYKFDVVSTDESTYDNRFRLLFNTPEAVTNISDSQLSGSSFVVYPVPSNGKTLSYTYTGASLSNASMKIVDLYGNTVYAKALTVDGVVRHEGTLQLGQLSSGVYTVILSTNRGDLLTKFIVID